MTAGAQRPRGGSVQRVWALWPAAELCYPNVSLEGLYWKLGGPPTVLCNFPHSRGKQILVS